MKRTNLLMGTLLVAGTSIGGGMLALPVWTSIAGFLPSCIVYLCCWLFMMSTGFLFVELSRWIDHKGNIVSMAGRTLGKTGVFIAWILYLFLFYCLSVAYLVGCGNLLVQFSGEQIPPRWAPLIFLLFFAPLIYCGAKVVGRINVLMMIGLGLSFFAFVVLGIPYVKTENLLFYDFSKTCHALPIAFTAFAYQGIVPTLVEFMNRDVVRTRLAIAFGSALTFVTYLLWQWLIQGIIPTEGPGGLAEALAKGDNAVTPLKNFIGSGGVYYIGQSFAFFALITSYFGVSLGLIDFLADGLKIKKNRLGKIWLSVLLFIPPLLIAYTHPHIFLVALDWAGGYGCALLLGLMPIVMVWAGRYFWGFSSDHPLPGGRVLLLLLSSFVFFELYCQIG